MMKKFLKGMDISSLPEHLDANEIFYDQDGEEKTESQKTACD